jgi:hypothetical protein
MPSAKKEPLFVRFANREADVSDVINALSSSKDEVTLNAVAKARENPPDLSQFRVDFAQMLADLADNGVSRRVVNYVDSYMKPSLVEFGGSSEGSRAGESRWVSVKDAEAPWAEAVVCYNLCLFLKAYGIREFKICPICGKFFTNKGKYAKYCSDNCKASGSK